MNIENLPTSWSLPILRSVSSINPTRKDWPSDPIVSFFEMSQVSEEGRMSNGLSGKMSSFLSGFTPFKNGDVILAKITPCFENGKGAYVEHMPSGYGLGSTEFHVVRADSKLDPKFFFYLSTSSWFRKNGERNMTGSAGQKRVPTDWLKTLKVPLPPLPEQKKIAKILGACDEAIESQERLITQKQQRKKGLMQQLLTGKTRFPKFIGKPWREVRLGDVFEERKETKRENLELLSVTGEGGVVKRDGLNRKDTSSEDKSRYKRVCHGDIAYNTMRMWQGVSGLSKFEGIVSPAYTIVKPAKEMDPTFSAYFFKLPKTVSLFHRFSQGLVNDTLNLKYPNFRVIKVTIPERDEQEAIGQALAVSDQEIALQQSKLKQLKQQKKGLMQQLLTGKVRVKID